MKKMMKIVLFFLGAAFTSFAFTGCRKKAGSKIDLNVFVAASLKNAMNEVCTEFNKKNPDVNIILNADSSGTLMNQIMEGFECDIFFSAAEKQMNVLEKEGFLIPGTRKKVLNNQLVLVCGKDVQTEVTTLSELGKAKSVAMCGPSVPAGKYTREALIKLGILPKDADASKVTTEEVSKALGGVEISEAGNVSKAIISIVQGASDVGTGYYSDIYGHEEELRLIEKVSYDLTGNVIYPVARIKNSKADDSKAVAADEFARFLTGDKAKSIFEKYYFDTNL